MKNFLVNVHRIAIAGVVLVVVGGCGSRQVQDSLVGSTAQRLVTYSIDDLARALPDRDFSRWSGKRIYIESHFVANPDIRAYADQRVARELTDRFDIEIVSEPAAADGVVELFYTSLGTDRDHVGFFLPLGFMPGIDESTRINLITLEKFHGIAEMYYYIGNNGSDKRGEIIQARTRTDALGLPIITIPISTIENR